MADQLNMNGLSLNESQHAPGQNGFGGHPSTYIPPHMRSRGGGMGGGPPRNNGYADQNGFVLSKLNFA
jgi:ATP-dependent RNA helicase DDX3X